MKKQLLPFAILSVLIVITACATKQPAKPKQLKTPEIISFNYYVIDSGMTVSLEFKNKLELDSLRLDFAVVTSNESGEGKTISETVKTSGKKLEVRIDRSYFADQLFYDSMMNAQLQNPLKLFRIEAKPVSGKTVLQKDRMKEWREKETNTKNELSTSYFDQRVEKRPDGYSMTSTLDDKEKKSMQMLYYPED